MIAPPSARRSTAGAQNLFRTAIRLSILVPRHCPPHDGSLSPPITPGITDFVAKLNAKTRLSHDYNARFLLPTARSQITYSYNDKNYVLMPDASFQLAFQRRVAHVPP